VSSNSDDTHAQAIPTGTPLMYLKLNIIIFLLKHRSIVFELRQPGFKPAGDDYRISKMDDKNACRRFTSSR
jgi:hypothetical protein